MTAKQTAEDRRAKKRPRQKPRDDESTRGIGAFLGNLGPGLVTGAADDDPSGISTYSQAGAAFGYGLLWTAVLSFPLMVAVQLMCARIGLVTRRGLASVLRKYYPPWLLWFACILLVVGNTINIAADLAGMAAGAELLTHIKRRYFVPVFALVILLVLMYGSYARLLKIFKWLTLVLFAYVIAAFLAKPVWMDVLNGDAASQHLVQEGLPLHLCRDSRDDHQSVSLLLAGGAGGGGRRSAEPRARRSDSARARARAARRAHRRGHRDARLERRHVFHHR